MVGLDNLRQYVGRDSMKIDQLLSPNHHVTSPSQNKQNNKSFETPPRPHRSNPECPGAPRRRPRDEVFQEDQIYPAESNSANNMPLFPFEDFERVDSMDSTIPAPRRLFDLEPKFVEPVLVEEHMNSISGADLVLPDDEEREQDETRQDHDSESRDT